MIITTAKAKEAADALSVELDGLTEPALKSAYRAKAKDCHPDYHGAEHLNTWARVSWANEVLKKWIAMHPSVSEPEQAEAGGNCRACGGTGRVDVRSKGYGKPLKMMCVMCGGTGELSPSKETYSHGD